MSNTRSKENEFTEQNGTKNESGSLTFSVFRS